MRGGDTDMSVGKQMLSKIFHLYLKILEKTVTIEWQFPERFQTNQVVGFWHEDSFIMNLVLKKVTEKGEKVSVLVTGDGRGDYIQYMLEKCGGEAIRMGYGFCNAGLLRDILHHLIEQKNSIAIAMDGPLGPRHLPKKTTFFLSEQGGVPLIGVTLDYSGKIVLSHRWDHYRIPLPFTKITVRFDDYGVTSVKHPPRVKAYQKEIECGILDEYIRWKMIPASRR